jgi:hypothetical protein
MGSGTEEFTEVCKGYEQQGIATSVVCLDQPMSPTAQHLCDIPGANIAFPAHRQTVEDLFRRRVDSILFPVAYDVTVQVSNPNNVLSVAPQPNTPSQESIYHSQTVFPMGPTVQSLHNVLLQFAGEVATEEITVSWQTRNGNTQSTSHSVDFSTITSESFDNNDLRILVALQRYQRFLSQWCDTMSQATGDGVSSKGVAPADILEEAEKLRTYLQAVQKETNNGTLKSEARVLTRILDIWG